MYRPDTERISHYFKARLPDQFDAVFHIDETRALEPLERWAREEADLPETYPSAVSAISLTYAPISAKLSPPK